MPFIGPAIAVAIGFVGTAAQIVGGIINIGLSYGLTMMSKSLAGNKQGRQRGLQTRLQTGGDVPRGYVCGKQAVAGQFVYWNTYGNDNAFVEMVYAIGDGVHDGIDAIWTGGKRRALTATSSDQFAEHYTVDDYMSGGQPRMWVSFHRGFIDQPASADLVANANPSERWTEDDTFTGVAYVIVRMRYNDKLFTSGLPNDFLFEVRGRRFYDWRKDDTAGGDGDHRFGDPETWEFSENPIVHLYNFRRGLYLNGELVVGMGVSASDLLVDYYTSAANDCDESVDDEPRYRCGTYISDDEEYGEVIERLLESCAGAEQERAGAFGPIAGVSQFAALPDPVRDGDIVSGYPIRYSAKLSRDELVNGVFGVFTDPAQGWKTVPYPAKTSPGDEVIDGERLSRSFDYPQVYSSRQAQALAEIARRLSRLQGRATITMPYKFIVLEPGDWFVWNSARYGNKTWMVSNARPNADQTITLTVRQIHASAFSDGEAEEVEAPGTAPQTGNRIGTVPSFSVSAATISGAGGLKIPALRVFWTPIADATVDAVLVEYRIKTVDDTGAIESKRFDNKFAGEGTLTSGLQASTQYEVRATIATTPVRETTWTAWTVATTLSEHVVPTSQSENQSEVTVESFEEGLRDYLIERQRDALMSLYKNSQRLAALVAEQDAANAMDKQTLRRDIRVARDGLSASFNEVIAVSIGPGSAIATAITQLQATVEGVEANLKASFVVGVLPEGAVAAYELQANAEEARAGLKIVARSDGEGGHIGEVWIEADRFYVGKTGESAFIPIFIVDTETDPPTVILNGTIVGDGSITAAKLNVAQLSAIVADLGEVHAGRALFEREDGGYLDINSDDLGGIEGPYILIDDGEEAPPPDPEYLTKLLLHFDGADQDTVIVDSSPEAQIVATVADAQLDTSQFKFGTASLQLDGTGDYAEVVDYGDFDFGTGDFTIAFWLRIADATGDRSLIGGRGPTNGDWVLARSQGGSNTALSFGRSQVAWDMTSSNLTWNTSTWYMIAVTRASGFMRIFRDGVTVASGANTQNYNIANSTLVIGARQSTSGAATLGNFLNGRIDELLIKKGVAKWTADFTPPAAPFTDSD